MRLEGRTALVTGGASASARPPRAGWRPRARAWRSPTSNEDGARAVAGEIDGLARRDGRRRHGLGRGRRRRDRGRARRPIDVLVNNAGTDRFAFFVNTDEALWDFVLGVNLRGMIAVTHAVLPGMQERGGGAIVNVASEAGRVGSQGSAVYSAAKAGVIGFTRAIARESARYGVRVNAVAPGPIDTPLLNAAAEELGELGERLQAGDDRRDRAAPDRPARGGRGGDRLPGLRRRLVRDRPDDRRLRRPLDDLRPWHRLACTSGSARSGPRDGFQNEPEVIADRRQGAADRAAGAHRAASGSRSRASCAPT